MKRSLPLALALLLVLMGRAAAAEGVVLRLRPQAGQTANLYMLSTTNVKQTLLGMNLDTAQTLGVEYEFKTEEVDPAGDALMTVTYKSILFKMDGLGSPVEYRSTEATPPESLPLAARGIAALVGQSFSIWMSPTGKVSEVRGVGAMMDRMLSALAIPESEALAKVRQMLTQQFGDEAIARGLNSMVGNFPDGPLEVGQEWSSRLEEDFGFPMVVETVSRVTGQEGGRVKIAGEGTIRSGGNAGALDLGVAKMGLDLSGDVASVAEIDTATGWPTRSETTVRFSGNITISGLPGEEKSLTYPISSVSTSVVSTEPLF